MGGGGRVWGVSWRGAGVYDGLKVVHGDGALSRDVEGFEETVDTFPHGGFEEREDGAAEGLSPYGSICVRVEALEEDLELVVRGGVFSLSEIGV